MKMTVKTAKGNRSVLLDDLTVSPRAIAFLERGAKAGVGVPVANLHLMQATTPPIKASGTFTAIMGAADDRRLAWEGQLASDGYNAARGPAVNDNGKMKQPGYSLLGLGWFEYKTAIAVQGSKRAVNAFSLTKLGLEALEAIKASKAS